MCNYREYCKQSEMSNGSAWFDLQKCEEISVKEPNTSYTLNLMRPLLKNGTNTCLNKQYHSQIFLEKLWNHGKIWASLQRNCLVFKIVSTTMRRSVKLGFLIWVPCFLILLSYNVIFEDTTILQIICSLGMKIWKRV